jgi:hypothetical protein
VATYGLTYAGFPFLMPTPEVEAAIASRIPLWQLREYLPPDREWVGKNLAGIAFAKPPDEPGIHLNQFFYPTGAARWSVFHGIVDSYTLLKMQNAAIPPDETDLAPQPFIWFTTQPVNLQDAGGVISTPGIITSATTQTNLYMLPPRPITPPSITGTEFLSPNNPQRLWLVTLVDERYYWQWKAESVVSWSVGSTSTWLNYITAVATALNITIKLPTIPVLNYGNISADSAFYTNSENIAILLDAAAHNIGCIVVRHYDGSYELVRYQDALANSVATRPGTDVAPTVAVAGGEIFNSVLTTGDSARRAVLPLQVAVTFPMVDPSGNYIDFSGRQWIKNSYGKVYTSVSKLSDLLIVPASDASFSGVMVIHDTCRAFMPDNTGIGFPTNQPALDTLAALLALNYYFSVLASLDEVYPGIQPWTPTGAEDIIWTYRTDSPTTRVQRKPYNWRVPEMQHELSAVGTGGTTSNANCGSCLCVIRDINNYIIAIQYPNAQGVFVTVPDCGGAIVPPGGGPPGGGGGPPPALACCTIMLNYFCGPLNPYASFLFTVCANGSVTFIGYLPTANQGGIGQPGPAGNGATNAQYFPLGSCNLPIAAVQWIPQLLAAIPGGAAAYCQVLAAPGPGIPPPPICPPGLVPVWNFITKQYNCVPLQHP